MKQVKNIILVIISLVFAFVTSKGENSMQNGLWVPHCAFYNQVVKITDTPNFTFFLGYNNFADKIYKPHPGYAQLFFSAKCTNPSIQHVSIKWKVSRQNISIIEYNDAQRYLAVCYNDGVIDLLYDNGECKQISTFYNLGVPFDKTIRSLSFSKTGDSIILSTNYGIIVLDPQNDSLTAEYRIAKPVENAFIQGNDMIFLQEKTLFSFPISDLRKSSPKPKKIEIRQDDIIISPSDVLTAFPVSKTSFLTLCGTSPSAELQSYLVSFDDDKWISQALDKGKVVYSAVPLSSDMEGVVQPSANGVCINFQNQLVYISPDGKTNNFIKPVANTPVAAWDDSKMWTFSPLDDFSLYDLSGNVTTPIATKIRPQTPRYGYSNAMTTHPEYGLLVMSGGSSRLFTAISGLVPAILSGYKNETWQSYSPQFLDAEFAKKLSSWASSYSKQYPVNFPSGIAVDPDNPSHVYVGSTLQGIARFDLKNPEQPILHLAQTNNSLRNIQGFFDIVPAETAAKSNVRFATPGFDRDGTLWVSNFHVDNNCLRLLCWPREQRLASANAVNDKTCFVKPLLIDVPQVRGSNYDQLLVLKHPNNLNKLIHISGIYLGGCAIYDHKGTPSDSSDDEVVNITEFFNSDGNRILLPEIYSAYEDPVSGNVFLAGVHGIFMFNPQTLPSDGKGELLNLEDNSDPDATLVPLSSAGCLTRDSDSNLWVGTTGAGVYCLSPDLKTLLGHWNSDNSALLDNEITAIQWDETSNSLFASSVSGTFQFFPPLHNQTLISNPFKTSPAVWGPEMHGWFSISGLQASMSYILISETDETVDIGSSDQAGNLQIKASDLPTLSTGLYRVCEKDSRNQAGTVKIFKGSI